MKENLKFSSEVVGLASLLLIGLVTIQAILLTYINEQTRQKEAVSVMLEELESAIGYRGLIHHFKNAVLRPDRPEYIDLAEERGTRALELLSMLESEAETVGAKVEDETLAATRAMVVSYLDRLSVVREGHAANRTIQEIDRTVAVDDRPATLELAAFRTSLYLAVDNQKTRGIIFSGALQVILAGLIVAGFIALFNQRAKLARSRLALLNDQILLLQQNLELKRLAEDAGTYLRDPITQTVMVSDMLSEEQGKSSTTQRKLFGLLRQVSENMLTRLTIVMECVRTEPVPAESKVPFDMKDLVVSAQKQVLDKYGSDNTVIIGEMPNTSADKGLIKLMWESLIESSVRFTRPGATADILIHGWRQDDSVIYVIKDRGVWVDADKIKSLMNFEPSPDDDGNGLEWRVGSDTGSGIGLALVKSVVDRHGGDINLDLDYKDGLCFKITLPLIDA